MNATLAQRVLAVVVTYHPDASLLANLNALRGQVDRVVVVDNGSTNVEDVEAAATALGCDLILNDANLGIARAFNQGAQRAESEGYQWLATFDQDSQVTPGMVPGLLESAHQQPFGGYIGVVAPLHFDRNTADNYHVPQHLIASEGEWRSLRTTISSGSLIPLSVLRQVGGFDEGLFIDFVDHDFCLRCRQRGYLVLENRSYVLTHSLGHISEHTILGRRIFCSNHSATRRYYMTRNQLEVYRRYAVFDPGWSLRGLADLVVGSALALLFESDRREKALAMLSGGMDFFRRRFGALEKR